MTDDPEPLEDKHLGINFAVNASRSEGDTEISVPNTDINYGFSPDVQIHILPKLTYKRTNDGNYYRNDDTEISLKYKFFYSKLRDSNWMVGIYPMLLLPTADKCVLRYQIHNLDMKIRRRPISAFNFNAKLFELPV